MKNLQKSIINETMMGRTNLQTIEANGMILLVTYSSKFHVNGFVFDAQGFKSGFKQLSIRTNKDGQSFVMANRTKFDLANVEAVQPSEEALRKELELAVSMKATFESIQAEDGDDLSTAIANQDFMIANLKAAMTALPAVEVEIESELTRESRTIEILVQEAAEYMNEYNDGHITVEIARDVDDGKEFFIVDANVHGYVEDAEGEMFTESRSFEYGYTTDKALAAQWAVKVREAMKKIAVSFKVNEDVLETDY